MNMKEKNAKKSKIHQLGFCFLKRESNYLDRQRQAILVCFSVMLSLGILSNILGFSGAFDPFFTVSNIVFLIVVLSSFMAYLFGKITNGEGNRLYRYRHPVLYRSRYPLQCLYAYAER